MLPGLRSPGAGLQGDTQFIPVLHAAGLLDRAAPTAGWWRHSTAARHHGASTQNFREFSDTFLTLAAIAPLLAGPTRITGIAHTRRQETDRVAGAARELRRLGQQVIEDGGRARDHARARSPRMLKSRPTATTVSP